MRWLRFIFCSALLVVAAELVQAQSNQSGINPIWIVSLTDRQSERELAREVLKELRGSTLVLTPLELPPISARATYISVGAQSLEALVTSRRSGAVLSLLTTKASFLSLTSGAAAAAAADVNYSAIFVDPNPRDLMRLAVAIFGEDSTFGVMSTTHAATSKQELQTLASELRVRLLIEELSVDVTSQRADKGDVLRAQRVLASAQALLALPDPGIYLSETIVPIVMTGLRRNQPIIGFSRGMVASGALATTYTPTPWLVKEVERCLLRLRETGKLCTPQGAKSFAVDINSAVARSLGIQIPETAQAMRRLP